MDWQQLVGMDWHQLVGDDCHEHLQKRIGSNGWLANAAKFDHNLRLSTEKQAIAAQLFARLIGNKTPYKIQQKQLDFEVLCANLLNQKVKPVSISFNRKDWKLNRYRRASYFIIERAINMLEENRMLEMKKGYGHEDGHKARRSKIWATEELRQAFEPIQLDDCIFDPVDLVNLKDESKRAIDYRDNKETLKVRGILRRANTVTGRSLVQYVDPESKSAFRLRTQLYSVYNNSDFKQGGRFYTGGRDGYQGLSEDERACIVIDEKPIVELDFSGMVPRLLYATENIQYDKDPYLDGFDDPKLRDVIKHMLIVILNCDSEVRAVKSGNKFLKENPRYRQRLIKNGIHSVKDDLFPMLKKIHKPISQHFYTGVGLRIQNLDAIIALQVIKHFVDDGIPILAIHDSFIVQRQYKKRLFKAMNLAYSKHTNGFKCPIK